MSERLFIRIVDGKPFEHPLIESNVKTAFPDLDRNNLPPDWKYFIRVQSDIGPYQKNPTCHYELDNSGKHYTDKWTYEEMTYAEKQSRIKKVKSDWLDRNPGGLDSWAFDEDLCRYEPPIPRPKDYDGQNYGWNEAAYQAGYAADAWYFISRSENQTT